MIDDKEIEAKADEFKLRPIEVEKDYVYGWLLKGIFTRPALASQLVLKGGNALRKAYLPDTRFSKERLNKSRADVIRWSLVVLESIRTKPKRRVSSHTRSFTGLSAPHFANCGRNILSSPTTSSCHPQIRQRK